MKLKKSQNHENSIGHESVESWSGGASLGCLRATPKRIQQKPEKSCCLITIRKCFNKRVSIINTYYGYMLYYCSSSNVPVGADLTLDQILTVGSGASVCSQYYPAFL